MSFKQHGKALTERRDPMQEFADRIVAELEKGVKPWVHPWDPDKCAGPQAPFNAASGDMYHGINTLILGMDLRAFATGVNRWATYKQAADKGWQVKKGEKSTTVFFYKPLEVDDKEAKDGKRVVPIMRTFSVFHSSQIEGIPEYKPPTFEEAPWTSDESTALIISNSGVPVRIGGDRAFYSPDLDFIQVPPSVAFQSAASEATVRLHELAHASGAKHRLDRDLSGARGSKLYSFEELIAEITSSFVGSNLNLPTSIENHASYIGHWLDILKEDKRAIFRAAASAQRASDWILNLRPAYPSRPDQSQSDDHREKIAAVSALV